jgi:hypothetical protein
MLKAGTRRDNALNCRTSLTSRTARTLGGARRRRLQIGHGIDPGRIVQQRTFVCQHLARGRRTQPTRRTARTAFARIVGHRSRFNFRFPRCLSFRPEANTRSTWRFNALMIPMRANIGGPSCSATNNSASIAACHSSASCSALGNFVMYWAASRNVRSGCFRPGNMIGSKNSWSHDNLVESQRQLARRAGVHLNECFYRRRQLVAGKIKAVLNL